MSIIDELIEIMSKVYLATCYFQENYGRVLQALATRRFLDQHSIENITINYDLIRPEVEKKKKKFYLKNTYEKAEPEIVWICKLVSFW